MKIRLAVGTVLTAGLVVGSVGLAGLAGAVPSAERPSGARNDAPPALLAVGDFDFSRPETAATGLQVPWGMDFLPDGSALVAQRPTGQVVRVRPGQSPEPVVTISGVTPVSEGGLLGLAVSPTYAQDGWIYVYFTTATDNRIARFRLTAPQTQQPILTGLNRAVIHNGGRIAFGPDGMLYVGVGDAGQTASAQDPQSRNGKILRIRPDGTVPSDNPIVGSPVYSLGHRHVQGLAWDAQGRLYATEFGQNTWDEINLIVAGGNYGWPTVEGRANDPRFRDPLLTWTPAEASPSGATIAGNRLFVASLRGNRLWNVPLNGSGGVGTPTAELAGSYGRLRTVEYGPDGWLWVTTSNRDGRGTPAATDDRILRFPPRDATTPPPTTPPPTTPPPTTPPPTTPPPTTPPPTTGPASCTVSWTANQWNTGFTADVRVTNRGAGLTGWTVTWSFSGNQQVTNAWNAQVTQSGRNVTARNAAWNGSLPTNGTVSFGFQATYTGTNDRPTDFQLNGTPCQPT
ncbi:PQQ-dependent sugar dehydrogenase [Verrucosispora sp. WMMD573]|uniref:PQQ-dependent sugar dehydrogenase n=1 Tax=Verrucosispora sp. WMMD573 TaxID=3015149 RepID=UPI00248C453F|nr:PQQ-dependent sugar dehydrogenase [Verrucosispora sp. WMMD573]WBB54740.1 PQQ-dependent sugar dehydrogenase [Verrucosispora sp. WMMD573]